MSQTIYVSNTAELKEAHKLLSNGEGGEIVVTHNNGEPYRFQTKDLQGRENAPVLIRAEDPDNKPVFEYIRVWGQEHLTIDGIEIYATQDTVPNKARAVSVRSSSDIEIRNSDMSSVGKGPVGTELDFESGAGLMRIDGSRDVRFIGNTAEGFRGGITIRDSYDTTIKDNEIFHLQGDGIQLGGANGVLIEGNNIHDFYGAPKSVSHNDFIQFWGSHISVNNQDVMIRENILNTGEGASYQMIFGRNEGFSENGFVYTNVVVEHNLIYGASSHMIAVGGTEGMIIRNNTVLWNKSTYTISVDGSQKQSDEPGFVRDVGAGTIIEKNIVMKMADPDGLGDNIQLSYDSTGADSDFRNHFVNLEAMGSGDLRDTLLLPDSEMNGEYGSKLTWYPETVDKMTAMANISHISSDKSLLELDASLSRSQDGYVNQGNASYIWTFDDGTVLEGEKVSHDFVDGGVHSYTLRVTAENGDVDEITRKVLIEEVDTISLEVSDEGVINTGSVGGDMKLVVGEGVVFDGSSIKLGMDALLTFTRAESSLYDMDSFNYGMSVLPDEGQQGTFLLQRGTMVADFTADGAVQFTLTTSDGKFTVTTGNGLFSDREARHINFVYDDDRGELAIYVDGERSDSVEASGMAAVNHSWGLKIGGGVHDRVEMTISDISFSRESGMDPDTEILDEFRDLSRIEASPEAYPVAQSRLPIDEGTLVYLDFEGDALDKSLNSALMNIIKGGNADGSLEFSDVPDGKAFVLSEDNGISIDRSEGFLFDRSAFTFTLDLRTDDGNTGGKIFKLKDAFDLTADQGNVTFDFKNGEGDHFSVSTEDAFLSDSEWHTIQIGYDAIDELLWLAVDGVVASEVEAHGNTSSDNRYWGLSIGGKHSIDGEIDNFSMNMDDRYDLLFA